jgi:hypothetical protein
MGLVGGTVTREGRGWGEGWELCGGCDWEGNGGNGVAPKQGGR